MNADSSFQERNAPSEFGNIGSDDFRMADESLVYFNLFGLQRTGTNLATLSLIRNFHIAFAPRGQEWKHGRVLNAERTHNGQPVNFLLCVKNPYAWLVSCYRYFQRHHCSDVSVAPQFRADPGILFEAFVRTPTYQFETPIHRWNERYAHWINELPINRTHIVRHEDQLTRPQQVLHEIQAKFSLVPKEVPFVTEDRHVCVDMRLGHSMDFGYYTNHEYMHDFTPALVDFVNTTLDWDLMSHFRYIPLRSSESTRANPTNVSAAKHGY